MLDKVPTKPADTSEPGTENIDWVEEFGSIRGKFFQESELARKFRTEKINPQEAVELAIEALKVFGSCYIYERQEWKDGNEYSRKVYILAYRPIGYRVDGDDERLNILSQVGEFWGEELNQQPTMKDLLKNETRVKTRLICDILKQDNRDANCITHKTYELTLKNN